MIDFNCDSNDHLSILFFGGELKETVKEPIIDDQGNFAVIKSGNNKGQLKLRNTEKIIKIPGLKLKPLMEWKTKKDGFYQTNEDVLTLLKQKKDTEAGKIATLILKIRELNKQISTYYEATEELLYPDNCLHAQFNHVQTDTGRLSSKAPNIQNQPKSFESKVKEHFTSRFGEQGILIEADFSQLEVRVEAQLSKDLKFMHDVLNGVDFHTKRLALKEKVMYEQALKKVKDEKDTEWIKKRSKVKGFSFAKQYGAGPAKIAEQSGLTIEEVKDLMQAEAKEYPTLALYHQWLKQTVEKQGYYQSFTGRKYYFKKYPAPLWLQRKGIKENYKPTEIQNYMTQGTATADISMILIGKFWREKALHNRNKYLMVNTVHDSILLDCTYINKLHAINDLTLLETLDIIKESFNYDWNIPIKTDIKTAKSWYECGLE